jgi:thioester reductase-like protein
MFDRGNVDGTQNVISLAKASGAALLHISTESVSGTAFPDDADRAGVFTERDFYIGQNYADNEYVRSKFLAELLVLDALAEGVNARIYRVGMLTATMDGRFQLRTEKNAFGNRLKAIRELGVVPLSMLGMQVEMTPADTCARAIIALSLISDGILPIYNVYNTNLLTGGELVSLMEACGFRIKVISDQEFASEMNDLSRQGRLELLTSLMEELDPGHRPPAIAITAALTTDRLKQIGFDWPVIDEAYLSRFMQVIAGEIEGRSGEI